MGLRITRDCEKKIVYLDQEHYINDILSKYDMLSSKPQKTPMTEGLVFPTEGTTSTDFNHQSCIPSIMYVVARTRPDIAYTMSILCQHIKHATKEHETAAKRVLRYLNGTKSYRLRLGGLYATNEDLYQLSMFVDASYGTNSASRKSTTGFIIYLGKDPLERSSRLQDIVASSSTFAKYIALHIGLTGIIH